MPLKPRTSQNWTSTSCMGLFGVDELVYSWAAWRAGDSSETRRPLSTGLPFLCSHWHLMILALKNSHQRLSPSRVGQKLRIHLMKSCVLSVKVPIKRNAEKQTAIQKTHQYVQSNSAKYTKIESTKDASKRVSCQAPSWGPRRWSHGSSRTVREWVARSCNSKIPSGSLCSAANYVKLPKEVKLHTYYTCFFKLQYFF